MTLLAHRLLAVEVPPRLAVGTSCRILYMLLRHAELQHIRTAIRVMEGFLAERKKIRAIFKAFPGASLPSCTFATPKMLLLNYSTCSCQVNAGGTPFEFLINISDPRALCF